MFDDYKEVQAVAYDLLIDTLKSGKISHAYLFETNRYMKAMDFVMAFVKAVLCPSHYCSIGDNCDGCNQCMRIDDGNYTEIKVIEPDGMWIKKEQLLELQEEFTKKGIEGEKRIYIIKQCEKMNPQAANSILKFLEEPAENIYAILVTDNVDLLLETIVSRCQCVNLAKAIMDVDKTVEALANLYCTTSTSYEEFISNEDNELYIGAIIEFILYLEQYKLDTIVYTKKLWHSKFKDKESNVLAFDLMINFYNDALKYKCGRDISFFVDRKEDVMKICEFNSVLSLVKKLDILLDMKENIKYNLNANLLVDKLIIDLGGV